MISSFIETLSQILAGNADIPGFGPNDLIGLNVDGTPIELPTSVGRDELLRIGRLQTLLLRVARASENPSHEAIGAQARLLRQSFQEAATHALSVHNDGLRFVQALETLIVGAVRALLPAESEVFDATYVMRSDGSIVRAPTPQTRSLD